MLSSRKHGFDLIPKWHMNVTIGCELDIDPRIWHLLVYHSRRHDLLMDSFLVCWGCTSALLGGSERESSTAVFGGMGFPSVFHILGGGGGIYLRYVTRYRFIAHMVSRCPVVLVWRVALVVASRRPSVAVRGG